MPELPEVETMCRGIASIVGGRIVAVEHVAVPYRPILVRPRIDVFHRRAAGRVVERVSRRGKRVVLELDSGDRVVLHPRMSGLVLLGEPPDAGHLRLRIRLEGIDTGGAAEILFWDSRGLGTVELLDRNEFEAQFHPDVFGIDALEIAAPALRDRLAMSRREIKVALLDQRAVAGVGNIYASEMLHMAGIHPCRACRVLHRPEWKKLHSAMRRVLNKAIRHCGSTLRDGLYRVARDENGSFQNHFRVYDRAGMPCKTCRRGKIERIVQAQRSTYFCPKCQG